MTLTEYFQDKPRGTKHDFAMRLGVSKTWLSLVISNKRKCSPKLARQIERITAGLVKRKDLRPDVFGAIS